MSRRDIIGIGMAASGWDVAIGKRLERLRVGRGWSMDALAARCRGAAVSGSQINKLEKGRQKFTAEWLYRLADALECPVLDLLQEAPAPASAKEGRLLGRVRELAEPDREAVFRIVESMSRPDTDPQ